MKVVFLECTQNFGYSYSANNSKMRYVSKGLINSECEAIIHNGILGCPSVPRDEEIITSENIRVITYTRRKDASMLSIVLNAIKLVRYFKSNRVRKGEGVVLLTRSWFPLYVFYSIIPRFFGYKIATISHEWATVPLSGNMVKDVLSRIYAYSFGWFCDAILPISEEIIRRIQKFNKPYLKLPILADFHSDVSPCSQQSSAFVYCASVEYKRVICMIIEAYRIYNQEGGSIPLRLIINGKKDKIDEIRSVIVSFDLEKYVDILSKLTDEELMIEYSNAAALLIPLDPNFEQDTVRFSQKIAEYLTTRKPVLTNNVGEIVHYFTENEAIICEYSVESFARAMSWVQQNGEQARLIGENGYMMGCREFDYRVNGRKLKSFFSCV